jgi:hypothetical protein
MLKNNVNDAQSMTAYPFVWFTFCFTNIYVPTQSEEDLDIFSGILCNSLWIDMSLHTEILSWSQANKS